MTNISLYQLLYIILVNYIFRTFQPPTLESPPRRGHWAPRLCRFRIIRGRSWWPDAGFRPAHRVGGQGMEGRGCVGCHPIPLTSLVFVGVSVLVITVEGDVAVMPLLQVGLGSRSFGGCPNTLASSGFVHVHAAVVDLLVGVAFTLAVILHRWRCVRGSCLCSFAVVLAVYAHIPRRGEGLGPPLRCWLMVRALHLRWRSSAGRRRMLGGVDADAGWSPRGQITLAWLDEHS